VIPLSKDVANLVGEFADSVDNRSLLYEKFAFSKVWGQPNKIDDAARWNVLRIVNRGGELLQNDAKLRNQAARRSVRPDKAGRLQQEAQIAEQLARITPPNPTLAKTVGENTRQLLSDLQRFYSARIITFSATLGGRLLINMAGGVVENAGICLDRCFGLPYLPGSAVKGIARCQALWEIRESRLDEKANLLKEAMLLFGFGALDIARGGAIAWAAGSDLVREICGELGLNELKGVASFLPAYPTKPPLLVVDIVNPHYRDYYGGKRREARDDENPVPNYFPAVEKDSEFGFAVLLNREPDAFGIATETLLRQARLWLERAIKEKGAGAKTAAGYGWFSIGLPKGVEAAPEDTKSDSARIPSSATLSQEEELIAKWRGKLATTGNFTIALPELSAVEDPATLRRIFEAVIPASERRRLRKNQPYWQSFTSGRHGQAGKKILERLGLRLG
jgi:CRISPR type III-B/RAMP module RAMP protein Cmr6